MGPAAMTDSKAWVIAFCAVALLACPAPTGTDPDAGSGGLGGSGAAGTGGSAGGTGGAAGAGGGMADAGSPIEQGCAEFRRALCDYYFRCPVAARFGFQHAFPFLTVADCYEDVEADCEERYGRPGMQYTRAHFATCAAKVRADACRPDFTATCTVPGLRGTKADGSNCATGTECTSGSCSRAGSSCGTCVAEATVGRACVNESQCGNAAGDLTCVNQACARITFGMAGATCGTDTEQCADGLLCSAGQCANNTSLADVGATCSSAQRCKLGLECVNSTCVALAAFADAEDCADVAVTHKGCPAGKVCAPRAGGSGYQCQTPTLVDAGVACNLGQGVVCEAPYDCRGLTPRCEEPLPPLMCP